ncbi:hypothetical protein [Telmatospirillum sp.]|uniref:hypothetical protein n=1 Tax=Telmatospirillum sp. TaxID=2079197 RepID=UPI002845B210|nr:hypothetical protein [Telmatospirillum sp.]MDR3436442.1 hypothetical protein [Telmatospirillum sp.]
MKRKIFLHGKLRNLAPDGLEFDAATVEEAISALCLQTKAFNPLPGKPRHELEVLGFDTDASLMAPLNDNVKELHLVPSLRGGKAGGVLQIIVGAVMVVVGVALSWCTGGASLALVMSGAMMIAEGLIALLSAAPKKNDPDASKYIGAPQNTTAIGTPIPILYGRRLVYGQMLSMNVQANDVALTYSAAADTSGCNVTFYLNGQTITAPTADSQAA